MKTKKEIMDGFRKKLAKSSAVYIWIKAGLETGFYIEANSYLAYKSISKQPVAKLRELTFDLSHGGLFIY